MILKNEKAVLTGALIALLFSFLFVLSAVFYIFLQNEEGRPAIALTDTESKVSYSGKKILYIDSYHKGYEWSDGITKGIMDVLNQTDVSYKVHRMDTKRNTSEEFKLQAAHEAKEVIDSYQPDIVLVSDDNAFKYLVQPYFRDADIPIVFSGLNWDASVYDAPYTNTTGMVEVSLTLELIDMLLEYTEGESVGYLTADVLTEHKNAEYYAKLFDLHFDKQYFVSTMEEWEKSFLLLQDEVDVVVFENNAGIKNWDDQRARAFALEHSKIPVGTTNSWTMQSSLIGITKLPEEQGEWSARAALLILDGATPDTIPVVTNKRGGLFVNVTIADKLNVRIRPDLLKNAEIVQ